MTILEMPSSEPVASHAGYHQMPAPARGGERMDHGRYLDLTLEEAELALREGSEPFGSVIVAPNGSIVSRGHNRVLSSGDQAAHSEMEAIRKAGAAAAPIDLRMTMPNTLDRRHILYTSAEPCLMCLGAILLCSIDTVVWAASSVTGSAYGAILRTGYQSDRLNALRVVMEPSPSHRSRSRAMMLELYKKQGNLPLVNLLAGP